MGHHQEIRRGATFARDPELAAQELYDAIFDPTAAIHLFFCSPEYDMVALGAALRGRFGDAPLIGCTTAGEITPLGYREHSITGLSLASVHFRVVSRCIESVSNFRLQQGDEMAASAVAALEAKLSPGSSVRGDRCFGLLLCDGLAMREELLVASIYRSLGDLHLFGGSAGDGTRFERTFVYHEGQFAQDRAVLVLVHTDLPFRLIKTEHFVASEEKMVVTEADPERRLVTEINGLPAGREYARAVGLDVSKLTPLIFATHPVVVTIGDSLYVRSIQQVNEDESLTFFCAIDTGIVLTVANGVNMADNLAGAFAKVRREIGPPQLTIGCDCILRYLECKQREEVDAISALMTANHVVGFATYGEQFNGMHVNQTFTGVAFGLSNELNHDVAGPA